MNDATKFNRKEAIAALAIRWPDAKLGKASNKELAFLLELVATLIEMEHGGKHPMARTLERYRATYEQTLSANGHISADNGDDVAATLRGLDPSSVVRLAEKLLGFANGELAAKYEHLNPGQQRMNAGNRIRAAYRKGTLTAEQVADAASAIAASK